MSIKIALIIGGHLSNKWAICKEGFKKGFEKYEMDVYVDTYYEKYWRGEEKEKRYTEGEIKELFKEFKVKVLNIEKTEELMEKLEPMTEKYKVDNKLHPYSMWRHIYCEMYKIKQSYSLMEEYVKEKDIKYDLVIRTRPDVKFLEEIPKLTKRCTEGGVYTYGKEAAFAIGTPEQIKYYCSLVDEVPRLYETIKRSKFAIVKTIRGKMGIKEGGKIRFTTSWEVNNESCLQ